MKVNQIFRSVLLAFAMVFAANDAFAQWQFMFSYDDNEDKDMVSRIEYTWLRADGSTRSKSDYEFIYDDERRLVKFINYYYDRDDHGNVFEGGTVDYVYTWAPGTLYIDSKECDLDSQHNIINFKYGQMSYSPDGYLISRRYEGYNDTFTWQDGNLVEYQFEGETAKITYSDKPNDLNIEDFYAFEIYSEPLPLGKRSKNLPTKIEKTYRDGSSYEETLSYAYDDKGRVSKVETEWCERGVHSTTEIMQIHYNESFVRAGVDNVSVSDATPVGYYDLHGQKLSTAKSGLNFVVYSDGSVRKIMLP